MPHHNKIPWPWHSGLLVVILGAVCAGCGPSLYYCVAYYGWRWESISAFSFMLLGSVLSLFCFLLLRQLFQTPHHPLERLYIGLAGVFVFVAHYLIVFQMPPHGLLLTNGLIAGIKSDWDVQAVKEWAIDRLTEYQQGTLKTIDSSNSSPLSQATLDPAIVPEYVGKIGGTSPSKGINIAIIPSDILNSDRLFDNTDEFGGYCLALSWYNFGILIGSPLDFQPQTKAQPTGHWWNFREVQPGMWVYYIEK